MQKEVGGLTRLYLKPYPLDKPVPEVSELIKNPDLEEHFHFLVHVTQNHKGLNWKIYRYKLTTDNYKSFIYAFAHQMAYLNTCHTTSWQVESSARRLYKALRKAKISLSEKEWEILERALFFKSWTLMDGKRKKVATKWQEDLAAQYVLSY